ncbi:hypothetical protein EJM73_08535 [Clostridium botulinum]|uniref:hypothetical protein n=1 Tax=Clostridium botulinum TaxID=1491 RepID=UPI001376176D|nr:hypothetical protein [Clostridium botulinum]NCI19670.1 hypothetical protein [Clostridium botulinum]NCI35708.1 hypothetical protein [Clostridium botulinum]NCI71565.1 hypothetical protein [Clostridium botulinum]NDI38757.1 hypothetical protein [Clostridium botulinum]HCL4447120.1 hypothetical protein [Clostridium botulinum]
MKSQNKEFLKQLQHEMLTQDNVGQANPRFWVVMQDVKIYGIADNFNITGQTIIYDGEEIGDTLEEVYDFLLDYIYDNYLEYTINFLNDSILIDGWQPFNTIEDIFNFMKYELHLENIDLVNYRIEQQIVPDTMFITLRECKEHIKSNSYHYKNPYPYAMTAWRSPQVARLYEILENIDWENV